MHQNYQTSANSRVCHVCHTYIILQGGIFVIKLELANKADDLGHKYLTLQCMVEASE
jgi:hypothetical protein